MRIGIFGAQAVLPSADGFCVRRCDILLEDDRIAAIDNVQRAGCDRVIDAKDRLAIPGLVNSHTHAYMTLFRNCADNLPFRQWLFDRIMPMEDRLRPGDCYWTTLLGVCEMLRSGVTSFLDMYILPDDTARAVIDSGIRAVISRGLQGEDAQDAGGLRRIEQAKHDYYTYKNAGEGRLTFMLAPHAPYTCAPAYLAHVADVAAELGVGIHTHLSESRGEIETIRDKYGCTPVELLEKSGVFARPTAAAHCVYLQRDDYRILREHGVSVLTNPASNLKLGNGIAPVPELLEAGVNVALGTDSAASNNTLNLFHEMNLLALLHKGTHEDAVTITSAEAFRAATVNGARALQLPVGEIAVGKKADLALLDLAAPQMQPPTDLLSALTFSANGSEVDTVIVNGKVLLDRRRLTMIDEERVRFETQRIYARVAK